MQLYNTRTRTLEEFSPLSNENRVTLYTCGPTVYDHLHIGNWLAYVYWDILVRTLLASGYVVERTMNITDVGHLTSDADEGEDKLEKGAAREGKTAWGVAEYYSEDFLKGMELLCMIPPEHLVRATDMIEEQLEVVRDLKQKGYTYQTTDGIYFDTAKFPEYATFAHLELESQKAGARVTENDEKRQAWDFALWKFSPNNTKRDMEWETPDDILDLPQDRNNPVMGFPGWHLECSAIALSTLGDTIDIHTGGIDHIPVHHTNEIAQSEAFTGKRFANYWVHNNHIKIDGTKISKSLGNTYGLKELDERGYSPMDLRMFILQSHYQSEGNFTFENLDAAKNRLTNWRNHAALRHQTHDSLEDDSVKNDSDKYLSFHATNGAVLEALQDNMNTPQALVIVDEVLAKIDQKKLSLVHQASLTDLFRTLDDYLGLQLVATTPDIADSDKMLILERQRARENQDWTKSDQLREELAEHGIAVRDSKHGPIWSYL